MVGVPWAMAFVEEQQIMEMERMERAREVAGEVCCCFLFFIFFSKLKAFISLFCFGQGRRAGGGGGKLWFGKSYGKFLWLWGPSLDVVLGGFSNLILSRVVLD